MKYKIMLLVFIALFTCANVALAAQLPGFASPFTLNDQTYMPRALIKDMVFVGTGCFEMGDVFSVGDKNERPVHQVCLDGFYIDKTEVIQRAFQEAMGINPSTNKEGDLPVYNVKFKEASEFCEKNDKRLLTEAEWEYAARSGGKKELWAGAGENSFIGEYVWFKGNADKVMPVANRKPNNLGIYDMSGNVWEWVLDVYNKKYYGKSPKNNPKGPGGSGGHVLRGGSYKDSKSDVRTTKRKQQMDKDALKFLNGLSSRSAKQKSSAAVGFRCAKSI